MQKQNITKSQIQEQQEKIIQEVINTLKKSKKYCSISDQVKERIIQETIQENQQIYKKLLKTKNLQRSKTFKEFTKKVKSKLYKISSMYLKTKHNKNKNNSELIHKSIIERKKFPDFVTDYINQNKIHSIIDLASGKNPEIFPFKDTKIKKYCAIEIDQKIIKELNSFFHNLKKDFPQLEYKIISLDILNLINQENKKPKKQKPIIHYNKHHDTDSKHILFKDFELCLILKTLDLIDTKGHKNAEELLKKITTKHIIVSFPTKTLSQKPMRFSRRTWLEKILKRLNKEFYYKKTDNEIFYFIDNLKE